MSSLNVIKHYASLATEVPPVTVMRVLIQPDGKILCDNGEGDSHRIARCHAAWRYDSEGDKPGV